MKLTKAYTTWLKQMKDRVRSAQIKAALKVNTELLNLYWDLGKEILDKEKHAAWGDQLAERIAKDLSKEFPEIKGFPAGIYFMYVGLWLSGIVPD